MWLIGHKSISFKEQYKVVWRLYNGLICKIDYISFKKFIYDNAIASNNEKINLLTLDNNYIDLLKNYDGEIKWKKYIFKLTFSFKF